MTEPALKVECPWCDEGQWFDGSKCPQCQGTGTIEEELQPMTLDDLEERDAEEIGR